MHYTASCYFIANQLNHHFSLAVVRTFVAMGKKTYAGGVNLHKFPKEMNDSRLLSGSMLWSSVLSDRLLSLSNAKEPNFLYKSNLDYNTSCQYLMYLYSLDDITSKPTTPPPPHLIKCVGIVCVFSCPYLSD